MSSTGETKMGGHCEATSNEFMTAKIFFANIEDIHRNVRLLLY